MPGVSTPGFLFRLALEVRGHGFQGERSNRLVERHRGLRLGTQTADVDRTFFGLAVLMALSNVAIERRTRLAAARRAAVSPADPLA